jgi:hypothetical protein
MRTTLITAALLATLVPGVAFACDDGERIRLVDEIESLVKRNAWAGVERKYEELMKARCEVEPDTHNAGAKSAEFLGKTYEMYERLQQATGTDEDELVQQNIAGIEKNYGKVEIRGSARKRAALVRPQMPFPPDQVKSIKYAQKVMEGTGSFRGMLPVGDYQVADQAFTVKAGDEAFQTILVGRAKARKPGEEDKNDGPDRSALTDAGLIAWQGPIIMVGGGFWGTRAPEQAVFDEKDGLVYDARDQQGGGIRPQHCGEEGLADGESSTRFVPGPGANETEQLLNGTCYQTVRMAGDQLSMGVVDLTVGYEVGLTYRAPEMGVFALANVRRTALARWNQTVIQGGVVVRPGPLRITAGPTWGLVWGRTDNYATWTNEGQNLPVDDGFTANVYTADGQRRKVCEADDCSFRATGVGGGFAASVGVALFDLGPFSGTIDVQANWMRDRYRSYSGIGARIGIVPKLERFQD